MKLVVTGNMVQIPKLSWWFHGWGKGVLGLTRLKPVWFPSPGLLPVMFLITWANKSVDDCQRLLLKVSASCCGVQKTGVTKKKPRHRSKTSTCKIVQGEFSTLDPTLLSNLTWPQGLNGSLCDVQVCRVLRRVCLFEVVVAVAVAVAIALVVVVVVAAAAVAIAVVVGPQVKAGSQARCYNTCATNPKQKRAGWNFIEQMHQNPLRKSIRQWYCLTSTWNHHEQRTNILRFFFEWCILLDLTAFISPPQRPKPIQLQLLHAAFLIYPLSTWSKSNHSNANLWALKKTGLPANGHGFQWIVPDLVQLGDHALNGR